MHFYSLGQAHDQLLLCLQLIFIYVLLSLAAALLAILNVTIPVVVLALGAAIFAVAPGKAFSQGTIGVVQFVLQFLALVLVDDRVAAVLVVIVRPVCFVVIGGVQQTLIYEEAVVCEDGRPAHFFFVGATKLAEPQPVLHFAGAVLILVAPEARPVDFPLAVLEFVYFSLIEGRTRVVVLAQLLDKSLPGLLLDYGQLVQLVRELVVLDIPSDKLRHLKFVQFGLDFFKFL